MKKKTTNYLLILYERVSSFWNYQSIEDKAARNLWLGLMIGLLVLGCVTFFFNGQI